MSKNDLVSSRSGILSFSSSPLMVVSQPILQSTYEGPLAGYLILGSYLSDDEIRTITEITSQNLTILPLRSNQSMKFDSLSSVILQVHDSDTITGYAVLPDITGNPQYMVAVTKSRGIFNQGLETIGSYIILLIIVSIGITLIMLVTIDHLVLRRIAIIIDQARTRTSQSSDSIPLRKKGDELSELAFTLTPVFTKIAEYEQELLKSEERYRTVVESQTDFICRFKPDGRYFYANQAFISYYGKTFEELCQGSFSQVIHPEDLTRVRTHRDNLTEGNFVETIEFRVIIPSGEIRWQQWTDFAMFDQDGIITEYQSIGRDITEKKQSQADLEQAYENIRKTLDQLTASEQNLKESLAKTEESEKKYRDLADSLPEFVFEVDNSGKLTFLNKMGFEVSGYQPQDLQDGLDAVSLIAPVDRDRLIRNMGKVLSGERISGQEYIGYKRDGTQFPIVVYSIRVEHERTVSGLRGFAIDITERKRMESVNRKLADIVRLTRAGIMTGTGDLIDVINPAYATMHGYTFEELKSLPAESLFSPDLKRDFPAYLKKAEVLGHVVFEADHIHRDGTIIPTLNVLSSLPDTQDSGQYWILNVQDISEHRLAWKILMESESLRESQRQLREVISRLPDATFVIDKDGWVILWNSAMEQLTGIQSDSIIGRGQNEYSIPFYGKKQPLLIDLVLEGSLQGYQDYPEIHLNGDTLSMEEYLPHTTSGPMYLSSVANPLYNSKGKVIGAIESIRDISSLKRAEEALLKANEKLNLLSSITRHDIRNRITVLFGIIPVIRHMSSNPDMVEMLDLLERAAYAIRDQIEFTRDYQDMGVHSPEWRDGGKLIEIASQQLQLKDVILDNGLHGLLLYADPLLERVFYNLIDNALRHGGSLSKISVSYSFHQTDLTVLFEDNGSGISNDIKEKIFERGYGKNTGLGLFLVREILSITGITIRETGISGLGARFELHVPDGSYKVP